MLVPRRSLRKSHTKTKLTKQEPWGRDPKETDSGTEETGILARLLFQSRVERQIGAYQRSHVYGLVAMSHTQVCLRLFGNMAHYQIYLDQPWTL